MTLPTEILDAKTGFRTSVTEKEINGTKRQGLTVFSHPLIDIEAEFKPFTNPTYGVDINQNIGFGGTPELIHNGGDTSAWGTTAVSGAWDFADTTTPDTGSACFSLTGGNNNDNALFEDSGGGSVDMSNYAAISGRIRLDTYSGVNHSISISAGLAGVPVGISVLIDSYIDTAIIGSYQSFIINVDDMLLGAETIDEITITLNRSGGSKPTFRIDGFQIEETGGSETWSVVPKVGTVTTLFGVRLMFADALASTVTNGTMHGLSYNKLLNLTQLTNGINAGFVVNNEVTFNFIGRDLSDFLFVGFDISNAISDGTNTLITLDVDLKERVVLDHRQRDHARIIVSDDLSGLSLFKAQALTTEEFY